MNFNRNCCGELYQRDLHLNNTTHSKIEKLIVVICFKLLLYTTLDQYNGNSTIQVLKVNAVETI